jgi:hypothetical protein
MEDDFDSLEYLHFLDDVEDVIGDITKKNKYSHYNPIATFLKMDSFLFDFGGLYSFNVNSEDPIYDRANPLMLHPEAQQLLMF